MPYPAFFTRFPQLDLRFPETQVESRVSRTEDGLVVFFTFHEDTDIPAHSHGAQWGTLIEGSVTITMNGETRSYKPGESWDIPAGVEHAVRIAAGTRAIDVFEEPDRYQLKR